MNSVVIDGSAILWVVHWPSKGTVADFVQGFKKYIAEVLKNADVYLVFDRYYEYSIKSSTRKERLGNIQRSHNLTMSPPLPQQ